MMPANISETGPVRRLLALYIQLLDDSRHANELFTAASDATRTPSTTTVGS
jgi:hypothetical protein